MKYWTLFILTILIITPFLTNAQSWSNKEILKADTAHGVKKSFLKYFDLTPLCSTFYP